ncbi:hypothetical protein PHYSODRAFT_249835 [Phytophthora sojae]|uniref:Uncharacterized protein n=1 Tax=Phytophthora sojae (strain P6497) TaxID=1094619 RepID=G4ZF51_PHYSP|nr:hypothetical protein PHYSODRAFT_249835 [Phytophthora sojae]EGZ18482.1 hypothetical protein PHYSODRAFT_249835 [Phytophthora sojae]|eukprot:XP_009527540.1 hypothetical protein PHYSODRAFT_249835 [Phytophthora sojae]
MSNIAGPSTCLAGFQYERLRDIRLPPEIEALPHVLQQLDLLLMTHVEAVEEAMHTGQMAWVKQLLPTFSYDHLEVLIVAAQCGHLDIVKWLSAEVRSHASDVEADGKLEYNALDILEEAIMNAGGNGRLEVVKCLMSEVKISSDEEDNEVDMLNEVAWRVLDLATQMGRVEVVKFVAEYARETEETGPASEMSRALSNAIDNGHKDVVKVLISAPQFHWEMAPAFKQALMARQQGIVEIIYELHAGSVEGQGGELIVHLARGDGEEYLRNRTWAEYQMVLNAFICASLCDRVDILDVLLESEYAPEKLFDTGFLCAARIVPSW